VQVQTGEIIALAGLGVLLVNKFGRRRDASKGLPKWIAYGDYVAFGLILTGLVVMYLQK
jgi:hypothetical protein